MKKLLAAAALTAGMAGMTSYGNDYSYYGSFGGGRRVPNWQKIYNYNPRPITHKVSKKGGMRKR